MSSGSPASPILGMVAWGAPYCKKLIDWHLPSLLMAGIDSFGPDLKTVIYTNRESFPLLEALPYEEFYRPLNIEILGIPDDLFNYHFVERKDPSMMKKICQYELVNRAWREDRSFIFTYPDVIYAPGSFRAFKKAVDDGYRATLVGILAADLQSSIDSDEFRAEILGSDEPALSWTSRFLNFLHPWVTTRVWSGRRGNMLSSNWPSYLYADEEPGLLSNIFHPHPVYVHPKVQVEWTKHGFEGDLLESAGIPFDECLLVNDGSAIAVALEHTGRSADAPGFPPLSSGIVSDDQIAAWARRHTMPAPYYQRQFFKITVPLALRQGYSLADCAGAMETLTQRAKRLVKSI